MNNSDLPVGIPWYFRPNEFLIESLRAHSVLSLIWALSALRARARLSFIYLGPTCFGYTPVDKPDAEADLLVVVDGESILCEVKSSWRSLRKVHLDDLVSLAKRLRPTSAILAIMEEGERMGSKIRQAKNDLDAEGIQFELLTPATFRVSEDPFF